MTDEAPPVVNDTEQLRAQLRGIADEKNLLDSIEEDVDRKRSHADEVRAKKRQRKDETIARERAIADQERDARQDELVKLENVRSTADLIHPTSAR